MKKGSCTSSSSAASGSGKSLAITERQKAAPSCVAALFQKLAKRKLFSSSSRKNKLLPPVRTHKFSPGRPTSGSGAGGGDEKTPAAKMRPLLLDPADYARSTSDCHGASRLPPASQDDSCSKLSTPGVVARLMGLSSMPPASHQRPAIAMDSSELGCHRKERFQGHAGVNGGMATVHQKQQRQGQLTDERHDNASQFNADAQALWMPPWHPPRVVSPLKSSRSVSSRSKARLIEAAARVLEPALQSRSRHPTRRPERLEYSRNSDAAADVSHNLPDQFARNMCDVDAPRSGAGSIGAISLHNCTYNQWYEENGNKNAAVRRPNQNVSCQVQPEGNSKGLHVGSSSQKARIKDNVQIFNIAADTCQDCRKIQPRNIPRKNVTCSPLKQNNLKQNALPVTCKAEDLGHVVQRQKNRTGEHIAADTTNAFVSSNRSISNTSLRSKGKTMDRVTVARGTAENKNSSARGHRRSDLRSDSSSKLKLRHEPPKATEKDVIIAKCAGLVSEKPRSASPNCVSNDSWSQVELHDVSRSNDAGIVSFTFSSPKKADSTSLSSDDTKGTSSAVLGSQNGSNHKRHYLKDCQDECKRRDIPRGRVASSLIEKISDLPPIEKSDELLWQCNLLDILDHGEFCNPSEFHETHKRHKANAKASDPYQCIPKGSNQRRPVSILQSTYAEDYCVSRSPHYITEAEFGRGQLETSTSSMPAFRKQGAAAEINSRFADPISDQHGVQLLPAVQDSKLTHPGEATSADELLLTNVSCSGQKILKAPPEVSLQRTFESDFAMEFLDSACVELCGSGYRSFSKLALICSEERLVAEVRKEMARCGAMAAGKSLDDLAASEADRAVKTGMSSLHEAFQISVHIEGYLLQELLQEEIQQTRLRCRRELENKATMPATVHRSHAAPR